MSHRSAQSALIVFIWGVVYSTGLAAQEYLLAPGDVIEFAAGGVPDLRQRSRVEPNGEISLPLLGQLKAAGRPISALRNEVRQLLPTRALRRKSLQGLDIISVDPDDITLQVAEYRPVYVNGDVAKPGEQSFRIGMTVRQVIALSGGYVRADQNPIMQSADLRREYQTLWTEFARAQTQATRVQAQINNKSTLSAVGEDLNELPVAPSVIREISRFETEKFSTDQGTYEREKASLLRRIQQTDEQIKLILEQLEKTKESVVLAMAELERTKGAFARGLTRAEKVADDHRLVLMTQTQNLLSTERLGQVKKDREELVRRLEALEDQRRSDLSRELQDANLRLADAKVRLQAVDEKLTFAGLLKSQLTRGRGASPELVLYRATERGLERIPVDEDAKMIPGDTIEVSLKSQPGLAAAEQ